MSDPGGSSAHTPADEHPGTGRLGTCIREVAEFLADTRPWHTAAPSRTAGSADSSDPAGSAHDSPLMFALVPTRILAEADPRLVEPSPAPGAADGHDIAGPDDLTPVEQGPLSDDPDLPPDALGEALAMIAWPDTVEGCLLVREIVVVPKTEPPEGAGAPGGGDVADRLEAPGRPRDGRRIPARLYAAVTRGGARLCLMELAPGRDTAGALDAHASGGDGGNGNNGSGGSNDGSNGRIELLRYEGLGTELLDALDATFDGEEFYDVESDGED